MTLEALIKRLSLDQVSLGQIMKRIRGWLDRLSTRALLDRIEKRGYIAEQDLRKIYPLLSPDEDQSKAKESAIDGIRKAVNEKLQERILSIATTVHESLKEKSDIVPFFTKPIPLPDDVAFQDDLAEAPVITHTDGGVIPTFKPKMSLTEVSDMFQKYYGYSVKIVDSTIDHPNAGKGLWLDGSASKGSIVAFFPGITYAPIFYRDMLGYPSIDTDNPYLISRFDGIVIDSKPWGPGLFEENTFPGTTQTFAEIYELEGRHPLAFGHFANHPPKGVEPNVLLAPFDIQTSRTSRPYIPNVKCKGKFATIAADELVEGLVIIASRQLHNEEIFFNYRLNPAVARPKWYTPVDEREDIMRWH